MRDGIHLVEALGLGGILFVAAPAKVGHIGQLGNVGGGVVSVLGQGSVTGLAGDLRMHSATVRLGLLIVALEALLMPGVGDGAGADQCERAGAVVSVFPKVFGNDDGPDEEKDPQPCN